MNWEKWSIKFRILILYLPCFTCIIWVIWKLYTLFTNHAICMPNGIHLANIWCTSFVTSGNFGVNSRYLGTLPYMPRKIYAKSTVCTIFGHVACKFMWHICRSNIYVHEYWWGHVTGHVTKIQNGGFWSAQQFTNSL